MKRGQVTIYMSMGIALVIVIIFIVYITNIVKEMSFEYEEPIDIASEQNSVKLYTQSCLEQVLDDALTKLRDRGGFIYYSEYNLELDTIGGEDSGGYIPLYEDRKSNLPNFKSEIEKYVDERIQSCIIRGFKIYEDRGWEINYPAVKTTVTIATAEVITSVEFPAEFTRKDVSFRVEKFIARKKAPLNEISNEIKNILEFAKEGEEKINRGEITIDEYKDIPYNKLSDVLDVKKRQYPESLTVIRWIIEENNPDLREEDKFKFHFATKLET